MNIKTLWTIGHSNREIAEFVAMLQSFDIRCLVDVRRFPGSRRQPQFSQQSLQESLAEVQIDYHHLEHLGGRRKARATHSPNNAWRVESFNAYADYMQTEAFQTALGHLKQLATDQRTAIMCSEAVPWRCHRRLIADALTIQGWTARDIFAPHREKVHMLTSFARLENDTLIYPDEALSEEEREASR